jgi:hypothetical protein
MDVPFTSAAVVCDNFPEFSIENMQAAMEKMRSVVSEHAETRMLTADDFKIFRAHRSYLDKKMEDYRSRPLVDTGELRILTRPRYDLHIPSRESLQAIFIEQFVRELDRQIADDRDLSDDTTLDCFSEADTEMEG